MTDSTHPADRLSGLNLAARNQVKAAIRRLAYEYETCFTQGDVEEVFTDSFNRFAATARVTLYLPVLAERGRNEVTNTRSRASSQVTGLWRVRNAQVISFRLQKITRERLEALATTRGLIAKKVPEVLFVCVHNAGRSQMAAVFTRHYAGTQLHIRTGGSDPAEGIHPEVIVAMKEIGLSLDEEFPKPLTDDILAAADVVITMGCGDTCPYVPGKRYEDWPIDDPAVSAPQRVRAIRDDIGTRVRGLLASLLPDQALPAR
ncbi:MULTISPECIES: arsenate reductase ArsC [unclassified Frankia]